MEELTTKYKLNKDVTDDILRDEGFRHGTYRCYLYKSLIQLIVYVDMEDDWWSYQVCNTDTDTLYVPYYDRTHGKNEVVEEIDKKVNKIFGEMAKKKILIKKRERQKR